MHREQLHESRVCAFRWGSSSVQHLDIKNVEINIKPNKNILCVYQEEKNLGKLWEFLKHLMQKEAPIYRNGEFFNDIFHNYVFVIFLILEVKKLMRMNLE